MVLIPAAALREIERYKRRVQAPRRALRKVYAPICGELDRLMPRGFELAGPLREGSIRGTVRVEAVGFEPTKDPLGEPLPE